VRAPEEDLMHDASQFRSGWLATTELGSTIETFRVEPCLPEHDCKMKVY
jgi:hypothetical protein